ncbi:hypothetical protein D3C81_1178700 [compost metagenome]
MKRRSSSQLCAMITSSSESVTWLASQPGRALGMATCSRCAWMSAAAARPYTKHSNSELLAIRLAPCRPVKLVSPMAYKPGTSVWPQSSTITPPQV